MHDPAPPASSSHAQWAHMLVTSYSAPQPVHVHTQARPCLSTVIRCYRRFCRAVPCLRKGEFGGGTRPVSRKKGWRRHGIPTSRVLSANSHSFARTAERGMARWCLESAAGGGSVGTVNVLRYGPCPSYNGRRVRINSGLLCSLYKGGGINFKSTLGSVRVWQCRTAFPGIRVSLSLCVLSAATILYETIQELKLRERGTSAKLGSSELCFSELFEYHKLCRPHWLIMVKTSQKVSAPNDVLQGCHPLLTFCLAVVSLATAVTSAGANTNYGKWC